MKTILFGARVFALLTLAVAPAMAQTALNCSANVNTETVKLLPNDSVGSLVYEGQIGPAEFTVIDHGQYMETNILLNQGSQNSSAGSSFAPGSRPQTYLVIDGKSYSIECR